MLANGNIYIGFGSQSDVRPWHGWIFAYAQSNLGTGSGFLHVPIELRRGHLGLRGPGLASMRLGIAVP